MALAALQEDRARRPNLVEQITNTYDPSIGLKSVNIFWITVILRIFGNSTDYMTAQFHTSDIHEVVKEA